MVVGVAVKGTSVGEAVAWISGVLVGRKVGVRSGVPVGALVELIRIVSVGWMGVSEAWMEVGLDVGVGVRT